MYTYYTYIHIYICAMLYILSYILCMIVNTF